MEQKKWVQEVKTTLAHDAPALAHASPTLACAAPLMDVRRCSLLLTSSFCAHPVHSPSLSLAPWFACVDPLSTPGSHSPSPPSRLPSSLVVFFIIVVVVTRPVRGDDGDVAGTRVWYLCYSRRSCADPGLYPYFPTSSVLPRSSVGSVSNP